MRLKLFLRRVGRGRMWVGTTGVSLQERQRLESERRLEQARARIQQRVMSSLGGGRFYTCGACGQTHDSLDEPGCAWLP